MRGWGEGVKSIGEEGGKGVRAYYRQSALGEDVAWDEAWESLWARE